MKDRILILGAGVYQIPAIKKAREMGLETVVASCQVFKYPGSALADIPLEADTTDIKKILKIAKEYQVKGVFTTGTDVALKALGKVNSVLNLTGPDYHSCLLSTDKIKMKRAFVKNKVGSAHFHEAYSEKDGLLFALEIGFPVMVKAVNSSGSRGISQSLNKRDFGRAWKYAKKYTKAGEPIIVEEFLKGVEFGAQAFVYKGKVKLVCIHNDSVTPAPYSTPIGHSYPFSNPEFEKEVVSEVEKAVKALGIDNSAANIDIIRTKDAVKILEIGARMGATCLPELTSIYTGIDVLKECIKMALGRKPQFEVISHTPVAGLLLRSHKSGRVQKITIPVGLRKNRLLDHILLDVSVGDRVKKFLNGTDRIGEMVISAKNWKIAEQNLEMLAKKIKIIIK